MADVCAICEGSGLRLVERADGTRVAQECACRERRRNGRLVEQARIPTRYAHCTLDDYIPNYSGQNATLTGALLQAQKFVQAYPLETRGDGLLLIGSIGVGKTHLAVGMLRALITERGAKGLFCDYRELLREVQNSYNKNVGTTELEVLKPVFDAEVLVLDELGASKPTEWVWDTIALILNARYNDRRTTIITTNYANLPPLGSDLSPQRAAAREETLGDRIGERMRSRLQEMCRVLQMTGPDFRAKVKRPSFG